MIFEIEYQRIEEGKMRVEANSESQAHRILDIELACGTASLTHSKNSYLKTTVVKEC